MRRVVASIITCLSALVLVVGPASAEASGPTNQVVVQNTKDGAALAKAKAKVAEEHGPTVAPENAAGAYASCTDCRTVAVAIQVVIVVGDVSDERPGNAAVAINYECVRCETYAYAKQVLLATDHDVDLSPDAEQQVASLQAQIASTAASGESFDQMTIDLDSLAQRLVDVVQTEINRTGTTASENQQRSTDQLAA